MILKFSIKHQVKDATLQSESYVTCNFFSVPLSLDASATSDIAASEQLKPSGSLSCIFLFQ